MFNKAEKKSRTAHKTSYLPDFCDADVFLRVLLVIELFAIVFALVSFDRGSLYVHIALYSVLMQWIGLSTAWVLCKVSRSTLMRDTLTTTLVVFCVTLIVTLIVSGLSVLLLEMMSFANQGTSLFYTLMRNSAVALILVGLVLRYFYLQFESRQILEIQSQARLQALQARIRPHFLFNSMNTIASLTHDQPDLAERAIENLSDLFRASLAAEASIPLHQELELTRDYIQLESLRLGERLSVNWQLPEGEIALMLPALTLQPLVENAIYHGIEPLPDGGIIDISIETKVDYVKITISNPMFAKRSDEHGEGNQMAVDNIRERLQIAFDGHASMAQQEANNRFTVTLKLPTTV